MGDLTFGQFIDYASQITVTLFLLSVIFALYRGWLVPGWVLKERDDRIRELTTQNEKWNELLTRVVEPIFPPKRR